jgi:DNA-binding FadR family transcriptional regulator
MMTRGGARRRPVSRGASPIVISDEVINRARGIELYSTAPTKVARSLGIDILCGTLVPGDRLPAEQQLLDRFGVSRTVLREAFRILDAKGFVIARTRVGTRVRAQHQWNFFDAEVLAWRVAAGIDEKLLRDLREARLAFEPFAARLSAERASPAHREELENSLLEMRNAVDDRKLFAAADLRFHRAVAAGSDNFLLHSFAPVVEIALVCATLLLPLEKPELREEAVRWHARLYDAIARQDGDEAAALMTDMILFGAEVGEGPRARQSNAPS